MLIPLEALSVEHNSTEINYCIFLVFNEQKLLDVIWHLVFINK